MVFPSSHWVALREYVDKDNVGAFPKDSGRPWRFLCLRGNNLRVSHPIEIICHTFRPYRLLTPKPFTHFLFQSLERIPDIEGRW